MHNRSDLPVYPAPKRILSESGESLCLTPFTRTELRINIAAEQERDPAVKRSLADLRRCLSDCFPMEATVVGGRAKETDHLTVSVRLVEPDRTIIDQAGDRSDQAYRIAVSAAPAAIELIAYGIPGLGYAVTSLRQMLHVNNDAVVVPVIDLLDWPSQKIRGNKIECTLSTRLMTKQDWFDAIDWHADLKFNTLEVGLYGCWQIQRDGIPTEVLMIPLEKYPELKTYFHLKYYSPSQHKWVHKYTLPLTYSEDFLGEVFAYARSRSMNVVPFFNSFGHNTLIPRIYPEVSSLNEAGEPELVGFCTSNEKTYELLFNIYDEIIDKYLLPNGMDTINLGLDEVWDEIALNEEDIFRKRNPWCQCPKCRQIPRGERFIEHTIRLISYLKKRGIKTDMAADMLIDHGINTTKFGIGELTQEFLGRIEEEGLKDSVRIIWWTYNDLERTAMFKDTQPELGLRGVTMPWTGFYHFVVLTSPLRNIAMMAELARRDNLEGVISYSANDPAFDRAFSVLADCTWNDYAAQDVEVVQKKYIDVHFGMHNYAAQRAFRLLSLLAEERPDLPKGEEGVISNFHMMMFRLSYFFFTSPEIGKPYPRIFPGEALQDLLAERMNYERALDESVSMAREAKQLFTDLATDSSVNQELASRYAYEADNFLCLCEDYLALLRMFDMNEEKPSGYLNLIAELAAARRRGRLDLMSHLERVKEHFLVEVEQRNHSIFMQYFSDLHRYVSERIQSGASEAEMNLDFIDNRVVASRQFDWLR